VTSPMKKGISTKFPHQLFFLLQIYERLLPRVGLPMR
jgi:hypothetical protein